MANIPNAEQYRDRNRTNGANPQRRQGSQRPYPKRRASKTWPIGLGVVIAAVLGLWLFPGIVITGLLAVAFVAIARKVAN